MKIILDNRDTENIHIDTYAMFTGEHAEEVERENMKEDGREDWDTVEIEYNHDAIVHDLAHASIEYVEQETKGDGIIHSIFFISSHSPRFYNYTTDWYLSEYDVDIVKLNEYIGKNYDDVRALAQKYDDSLVSGEVSKDNLAHAGLCHYLNTTIIADDYNIHMLEKETDIYYENANIK